MIPWHNRRSNQSILKKISPECSLEGLMLKLKLQSFRHLLQRADSFEKTLMLGMIEGGRRRGQQRIGGWMASLTQWRWVWVDSGSWWWTGRPRVLWSMVLQRADTTEWLNWTECEQGPGSFHFLVLPSSAYWLSTPRFVRTHRYKGANSPKCYLCTQLY